MEPIEKRTCVTCRHYMDECLAADLHTYWRHICSAALESVAKVSYVTGGFYLEDGDVSRARCARRNALGECSTWAEVPMVADSLDSEGVGTDGVSVEKTAGERGLFSRIFRRGE